MANNIAKVTAHHNVESLLDIFAIVFVSFPKGSSYKDLATRMKYKYVGLLQKLVALIFDHLSILL